LQMVSSSARADTTSEGQLGAEPYLPAAIFDRRTAALPDPPGAVMFADPKALFEACMGRALRRNRREREACVNAKDVWTGKSDAD
jgi:hypothetical protein